MLQSAESHNSGTSLVARDDTPVKGSDKDFPGQGTGAGSGSSLARAPHTVRLQVNIFYYYYYNTTNTVSCL